MQYYQARLTSNFDNPYHAQLFLDTILSAIKKTRWNKDALPTDKIQLTINKMEGHRDTDGKSPIISVPRILQI